MLQTSFRRAKEVELANKEKDINYAFTSLDKKRRELEQWRHQQELEWHGKLQNKEAVIMTVLKESVCTIEKERLNLMEASKNKYEKLEARLQKAPVEVEAKKMQLKDTALGYQNEQKQRLAEIDLREKLMKEELKHFLEKV